MKLTLRFVLLVALLLMGVGASTVAGLRALTQLDDSLDDLVTSDVERLLSITHSRRLFRSMVVLERDYLLGTAADRPGIQRKIDATAADLLTQIDHYAQLMPPEDTAEVEKVRRARERWIAFDRSIIEAVSGGEDATALSTHHTEDPVSWEGVIGSLVKANEQRLAEQAAAAHATHAAARSTLLAVSSGAALVAAVLGYVILVGIRRTVNQSASLAANLERLVEARTADLAARQSSLRRLLDSTGEGILAANKDGQLVGEVSAAATRWFGEPPIGVRVWQYLHPQDGNQRLELQLAFDQLQGDVLPSELSLAQMPKRIVRADATYEVEYRPVTGDTSGVELLVIARDITARLRSEEAAELAREGQHLVTKLLADKQGFSVFVGDVERLLGALEDADAPETASGHLRALEASFASFGLTSLQKHCLRVEEKVAIAQASPTAIEVADLGALFREKLRGIEAFLTRIGREDADFQHAALTQSLLERRDYQQILEMVELWSWARTSERLSRLRAQIDNVARRLDKPIRVEIAHHNLHIPGAYLERFFPTLANVARYAVEQGIESAEERQAAGKPREGTIRLCSYQTEDAFYVEVADDGRGLNRDALLAAARRHGVTTGEDATLTALLFRDDMGGDDEATAPSGRRLGMAATRDACEAEGGRISIDAEPGRGTSFLFRFRKPIVKTGALAAKVERRWSLMPAPIARA
jgi:two-component system chemotaxis sensor kinase CheA